MSPWSFFFGLVVGLSLGLTGGGGAIFAVPLLVFGLHLPPREAVGVSLAAVGATALVGFLHQWRLGQVEIRTGWLFAVAGMLGAPLGSWISRYIPESLLLLLFAGLMVLVAVRVWRQAARPAAGDLDCNSSEHNDGPTCQRDTDGTLILTSRCAVLLLVVGSITGVLSGMFGVGGGFVIVPALVLFSGMSIHRAVGTSLMVIALVSVAGVTSQVWAGSRLPSALTAWFVGGGIAGLFVGQAISHRISGATLQRVFAVAMILVAALVILRHVQ
ncbi:MAG: sulfite exporter TauE/SafE family protein [Pirellulales bacterium]